MPTQAHRPVYLLLCTTLLLLVLAFPVTGMSIPDDSRSIKVNLKSDTGGEDESVALYKGSYALLIGVSKYNSGWPVLEAIPSEIAKVETLLQDRGFAVTKIIDPDAIQLQKGFETFINTYGLEKENQLLFFFSGHGYTRDEGVKGYLVPVDAPDPDKNLTGFLQKALGMNQVLSWARDIEAKHALFLFDSCFSGTIFKQKSRPEPPRHITRLTIEPVRQFITAGSAGEEVPANSTFTPAFIDALRFGLADLNKDGYVSATELGLYLQTEVPAHTDQNPQFGKIRDYELSRGDFIFLTDATLESENLGPKTKTPYSSTEKLGILKVNSTPVGAEVYIDTKLQGSTPITLSNVAPGPHLLRVNKSGYREESKQIQITAGRHITVDFPLSEQQADGGTLTIETHPTGASVKIAGYNGYYNAGMQIPAGNYSLEVSKLSYITEMVNVQIREAEDLHLTITLKQQEDTARTEEVKDEESTPQVAQTKIAPAKKATASAGSSKKTQGQYPGVPQSIIEYIEKLHSPNTKIKRDTAKTIFKKNIKHPILFDEVERELLNGYNKNLRDSMHIDAMSWLCNILGSTKQSRYKATLKTVAKANTNDKLTKYAQKNMRHLR